MGFFCPEVLCSMVVYLLDCKKCSLRPLGYLSTKSVFIRAESMVGLPLHFSAHGAERELVSFHGWVTHWHVVASSSSLWFGCSGARKSEPPTPWFVPSRLDWSARECSFRDQAPPVCTSPGEALVPLITLSMVFFCVVWLLETNWHLNCL